MMYLKLGLIMLPDYKILYLMKIQLILTDAEILQTLRTNILDLLVKI